MRRWLPLFLALPLFALACKGSDAPQAQPQPQQKQEKAAAKTQPIRAVPAPAKPVDGRIEVQATADGFSPSRIEAEGGKPLKLVFTREVERTCMTAVVFPTLDIEKDLPLGETVEIEVTPEAGGTIPFECPMGHGKSSIKGT